MRKDADNFRKHGITFADAIRIFEGFTFEYEDDRFEYEEIRQVAIGVANGVEIFVVFADISEDERRIISARAATRKEREDYWKAFRRYV